MAHPRAQHQPLPVDFYVLVLEQLPDLRDKLAFSSICRASRAAAGDARCWKTVDVMETVVLKSKNPPALVIPATTRSSSSCLLMRDILAKTMKRAILGARTVA